MSARALGVGRDDAGFEAELDDLRRARLRLLSAVGACAALVVLVLGPVLERAGGLFPSLEPARLHRGTMLYHAASLAVAALLLRLRRLRTRTIVALDVALFGSNVLALAVGAVAVVGSGDHFPGIEGIYLALVLHGVFVPLRARYSVVLAAVATVGFPLVQLAGYVLVDGVRAHWDGLPGPHPFAVLVALNTLAVAVFGAWGVLSSWILHGLARDAYGLRRLGNYVLERELDAGGMGRVHVARHRLLRRPTAVKILEPGRAATLEDTARFEREVDLAARLCHPNTITIYDFGRAGDGTFYYAMELLEGWNLHDLVRRHGPLPPGRVIHVLRQVCGSLAEAHGLGIVHRDVKPSNVFLTRRGGVPDFVKVIDFGIGKRIEAGATLPGPLSQSGAVYGTPQYVSPEAVRNPEHVDGRADLYAVGALGCFLLTGREVFDGTPIQVLLDHLNTPPRRPSVQGGRDVPRDLEDILMRCMEKEPARRPQSAEALEQALAVAARTSPWSPEEARAWWQAADASPAPAGPLPEGPPTRSLPVMEVGRHVDRA